MTNAESADAPNQDLVVAADGSSPDVDDTPPERGLMWHVTTEPNPFARQLVFTEDDEEFLWWQLDPLALNSLLVALTQVRDHQLAALATTLGGSGLTATTPPSATAESLDSTDAESAIADEDDALDTAPTDTPSTLSLAWWARHKLLAFLLSATVLLFLIGLLNGQG